MSSGVCVVHASIEIPFPTVPCHPLSRISHEIRTIDQEVVSSHPYDSSKVEMHQSGDIGDGLVTAGLSGWGKVFIE